MMGIAVGQLPQRNVVGSLFVGKPLLGEQSIFSGDLLCQVQQEVRILDENRTCQMGTEQTMVVQTFVNIIRSVAQTHLYGEERSGNAVYRTALVDKTDQWFIKQF